MLQHILLVMYKVLVFLSRYAYFNIINTNHYHSQPKLSSSQDLCCHGSRPRMIPINIVVCFTNYVFSLLQSNTFQQRSIIAYPKEIIAHERITTNSSYLVFVLSFKYLSSLEVVNIRCHPLCFLSADLQTLVHLVNGW